MAGGKLSTTLPQVDRHIVIYHPNTAIIIAEQYQLLLFQVTFLTLCETSEGFPSRPHNRWVRIPFWTDASKIRERVTPPFGTLQ